MRRNLLRLLPQYSIDAYKGQGGKVAVIGGCFQYTGAPYYAAMAALRGGGELAHILCTRAAATPIKSYSPEPIVHGVLPESQDSSAEQGKTAASAKSVLEYWKTWQTSMTAVAIGPGLGRDSLTGEYLPEVIAASDEKQVAVIDADGLWFVANDARVRDAVVRRARACVLTPNANELERICDAVYAAAAQSGTAQQQDYKLSPQEKSDAYRALANAASPIFEIKFQDVDAIDNKVVRRGVKLARALNNVTLVCKGAVDIVTDGRRAYAVAEEGSHKRAGGIGDVLTGLTAQYVYWAAQKASALEDAENPLLVACVLSTYTVRLAGARAFARKKWSLTAPDIIDHIGDAFESLYGAEGAKL